MEIKAITLDFWNTLYKHRGTSMFRKSTREDNLFRYCKESGIENPDHVAKTFFNVVDSFIKQEWTNGHWPITQQINKHAVLFYNNRYSYETIDRLCGVLYSVYQTVLKPIIYPHTVKFLQWARKKYALYLISDTFTIIGKVLDTIMKEDGILQLFSDTLYSDKLGTQKPDTLAIRKILKRENIKPNQVVHIGDLLDRDYEMSKRAGCYFILLDHDNKTRFDEDYAFFGGVCKSFVEIKRLLKGASFEKSSFD